MIPKMHAMLLSVFHLKFRFDVPLIHTFSVDFKSWVVACIAGFFVCMWCAAKKHCISNNVLGIQMPSLGSLKIAILLLLFPTAEAALPYSMISFGDILISGIHGALALCIAILRGSKNRLFSCAFVRHTVIIMNWFQTAQDDATALLEDRGDGPEDVSSSGSDHGNTYSCGHRAVQLLSIRANFGIKGINGCDWRRYMYIYRARKGEVREEGMVDLVPIGPYRILQAYGHLGFMVFPADGTSAIKASWSVITEDDEVEERTQTIDGGLGRKLEITYLVIPDAIETHFEVKLNLNGLGLRRRAVYGSIKASTIDYGGKSVHLFSCPRGKSLSFPCGSTCILPLSPPAIALPNRPHFKVYVEVDLRVITTRHSQEEGKNLKYRLVFTHRNTSEEREVDGDQVEVNVTWYLYAMP